MDNKNKKISLALSGGGARAIAFHLGCLRALHKKDMLKDVSVISTISGGSVIGAIYAYTDCSFEEFDRIIIGLLRKGLARSILKEWLKKGLFFYDFYDLCTKILKINSRVRKHGRLIAFMNVLDREYFFYRTINKLSKKDLNIVINATELSTRSAFRFGSKESGNWRHGKLKNNTIRISKAVVTSAAYPLFFPSLEFEEIFIKEEEEKKEVVILSDGGIYDNLGTTCLEYNKSRQYSYNSYPSENIISCNAGEGQRKFKFFPTFLKRISETINTMMYRIENQSINKLFEAKQRNQIHNIIYSHLGQDDKQLISSIPNLTKKESVCDYPTNFNAMNEKNIELITKRGEQLTAYLIETNFK